MKSCVLLALLSAAAILNAEAAIFQKARAIKWTLTIFPHLP